MFVWSLLLAAVASVAGPVPAQVGCLLAPVDAPVVDAFRDPACAWCPGNRGLTYGVQPGTVVRAAGAGTVTFSGVVVDARYVVVEHGPGGWRATYGGLASTTLVAGDVVAAGDVVGPAGGHEVHFGLRDGERYVDPGSLLGRVVERPRLVPTDGTPARPGRPTAVECPTGTSDTSSPIGTADTGRAAPPPPGGAALPLAGLAPSAWRAGHHDYPAIDVLVPTGTPVVAWHGGTVRNTHTFGRNCASVAGAGRCPSTCGIGVTVVDATWPDVTWTYCHLSTLSVGSGDVLTPGRAVGRSGNTGRSGAPHLHLEVRVNGRQVCPQPALAAIATSGRMPDPHRLPTSGCTF